MVVMTIQGRGRSGRKSSKYWMIDFIRWGLIAGKKRQDDWLDGGLARSSNWWQKRCNIDDGCVCNEVNGQGGWSELKIGFWQCWAWVFWVGWLWEKPWRDDNDGLVELGSDGGCFQSVVEDGVLVCGSLSKAWLHALIGLGEFWIGGLLRFG